MLDSAGPYIDDNDSVRSDCSDSAEQNTADSCSELCAPITASYWRSAALQGTFQLRADIEKHDEAIANAAAYGESSGIQDHSDCCYLWSVLMLKTIREQGLFAAYSDSTINCAFLHWPSAGRTLADLRSARSQQNSCYFLDCCKAATLAHTAFLAPAEKLAGA